MAGHDYLWPRFCAAAHGRPTDPPGDYARALGGSVDYKLMRASTGYIRGDEGFRERLLGYLEEMRRTGHLALRGPSGVACEQGSPGMHWSFNIAPVTGAYLHAVRTGDEVMANYCLDFLYTELNYNTSRRYKGQCWIAGPRIKDGQRPHDGYRDPWVAFILGEKVKKPSGWWEDDSGTVMWLAREAKLTVSSFNGAMQGKYLLHIPSTVTVDGIYLSSIDDTPLHRAVLGKDACNRVVWDGNVVTVTYDWGKSKKQFKVKA